MGKTKIQWTESTWNPVVGCSHVSSGCQHCYAERMAYRLACMGQEKYQRVIHTPEADFRDVGTWVGYAYCDEKALEIPLHWKKPRQIFVCSMGDLFHESVPFEFIDKVMAVIALCPQHTFQVLTKRPERMAEYINWQSAEPDIIGRYNRGQKIDSSGCRGQHICGFTNRKWPLKNLWLGATVEHPDYKNRIDILRQIPAVVRFLSIEPCLADMGKLNLGGISWVIVGGESGAGARHCPIDNIANIVRQCKKAGVPVFVKQIHFRYCYPGTKKPDTIKLIKDINQFPEELRIREYPQIANEKGGE